MPTVDPSGRFIESDSYSKVAYVLWVRLMKALTSIQEASTAWVQPSSLPFFDPSSSWLSNYTDFDISRHLRFDADVEKTGQSCDKGKPSIDYFQCSPRYNSLFFRSAQSFNRYARKRGPAVIQPKTALIWPGLSISHFLGNSVPAWSKSSRPLEQTFAQWIFDESVQCDTGSPDTSVCAEDPTNPKRILAVVPWLGGDYNPFESCDTVGSGTLQEGEGSAHESISTECHPLICGDTLNNNQPLDTAYYSLQPSGKDRCYLRNKMQATLLNVPTTTKSNLCRQVPQKQPDECTWKQGMLMLGMKGGRHTNLYTDAPLKPAFVIPSQGAGLFVHGGNPLYYTMKGTSEEVASRVHSILRGSLDDLAGNHIVFKVAVDESTLEPYMYVHRTPLASDYFWDDLLSRMSNIATTEASPTSLDPLEEAYSISKKSARQTGGNSGWLSNLASDMRSEQPMVDRLYPPQSSSASSSSSSWSCPLLRFAFWSKVL